MEHWYVQPIVSIVCAIISLLGSLAISLYLVPGRADRRALKRQTNAFYAHIEDVVRDFRESSAVMSSIAHDGFNDSFPLQNHLTKLATPDTLLTTKIVTIGDLEPTNRRTALKVENLLINVNRDVDTLLRLIDRVEREPFDKAAADLSDKLYNLANMLLREVPGAHTPEQNLRPKTIYYEDGTEKVGVAFTIRSDDLGQPRLIPPNYPGLGKADPAQS